VDQTSQVVVVGAGIVGCAIAYELARRGVHVRVIDRREVGQGATQASAGVLAPYIEAHDRRPLLDLTTRSLDLYDEFVARIVEDSGAAVQYVRTGTLEIATGPGDMARLESIHAACIERGIGAELLDAGTVRRVEPQLAPTVRGGVIVESHGFIGAAELTAALQRAAAAHGVSFQTSAVTRIEGNGSGIRIETAGDAFACESAVMAAGSWSGHVEIEGASPVPIRPVRGQLLHLDWPAPPLRRVIWAPDCYLVPWSDGSVLAGATSEEVGFDERATVAGVRELIDAAQRVTPAVSNASFQKARVGLRPATPDALPVIGPSGAVPGLVYACGHYRNGILLAPLTASVVADFLVDQRLDPVLDLTSPSRFGAC
jgi:glycine oxidase